MALLKAVTIAVIALTLPTFRAVAGSDPLPMFVTNASTGAGLFFGRNAIARTPDPAPSDVLRWDDFIAEAAFRFDIPLDWIRGVMSAESDGRAFVNGTPITSRGRGDRPHADHARDLRRAEAALWIGRRSRRSARQYSRRRGLSPRAVSALRRSRFSCRLQCRPARLEAYRAGTLPLPDETARYLDKLSASLATSLPARAATELAALRDSHDFFAGGALFFTITERPTTPLDAP